MLFQVQSHYKLYPDTAENAAPSLDKIKYLNFSLTTYHTDLIGTMNPTSLSLTPE